MGHLYASVLAGNVIVGRVELEPWDPAMGVAGGIFVPNENYVAERHATMLDGVELLESDRQSSLKVVSANGQMLQCEAIALIDYADYAGDQYGRELTIFGVDVLAIFNDRDEA